MKDVIYLVIERTRVVKMTKSPVAVARGQVLAKVNVEVPYAAFSPPVIERTLVITDWQDGTELNDLHLSSNVITEAEAERIVRDRLRRMEEILSERGATVTWPEGEENAADR